MFTPAFNRIEVKPLKKTGIISDFKEELVELGEIVSLGRDVSIDVFKIGDILAFEGWGCTKITYNGEEKWVVSTNENVILGVYAKE